MKQLKTLVKEVESMNDDMLYSVVECEHVSSDTLTKKEKQSFLALNEVRKAVVNSKYDFFFDCDFATSDFHSEKKVKAGEAKYLVDYACVTSKADVNTRLLQIYATSIGETTYFRICTTCKEALRNADVFENIGFKTRYNTKTGRAKTTQRSNISYDDIVATIKNVLSVLEESKH